LVKWVTASDAGSRSKILTRLGSGQLFVAPVGSGQPFLVWVPVLKIPNFSIFFRLGQNKNHWVGSKSTRVTDGSASNLLWVKSMLGSGHDPSLVTASNLLEET